MKAILESKLIVPADYVPLEAIKAFQRTVKDKEGNEFNLDFYEYNPETNLYSFSRGDIPLLRKYFSHIPWEDRRTNIPMESNDLSSGSQSGLTFTGTLKPNQVPVIEKVFTMPDCGYGQISAPPRFGKTVMMTYMACGIKQRTLFLSHSIDLAKQAMMTFYDRTNVMDLEAKYGKQIIGLVDTWEDLDRFDVAFMPYQRFVSGTDADEMLSKFKNRFGVVFVDEVHKANAQEYSRIVNAFNPRWRIGVSGTIARKDQMHVVAEYIFGPVIAEGFADQIPCDVHIVNTRTPIHVKAKGNFFWTLAKSMLAKNHRRNQIVLNDIKNWARAGHSILAVTETVAHIEFLISELKKEGFAVEGFHRKAFKNDKVREQCLQRMRSGETQILIAIRQMVLGLDIPRLTTFFNLMPTANPPNYYQELSRVRTPIEGKDKAFIIDYYDDHFLLKAVLKTRLKEYNRLELNMVRNDMAMEEIDIISSSFLNAIKK